MYHSITFGVPFGTSLLAHSPPSSALRAKSEPTLLPCFIFPPFYDCKWLELECYRQDEILLHDLTGLNQPTQPGTRPSHNWEVESAPSLAAGTHPMNSPGKLCLLQMRYRDLIMPDFSFFKKKDVWVTLMIRQILCPTDQLLHSLLLSERKNFL